MGDERRDEDEVVRVSSRILMEVKAFVDVINYYKL